MTDYRGFLYAGSPRFRLLFGRDSLISSWQLLHYDPEIAAVTLKTLANLQSLKSDPEADSDPGKILHEMWDTGAGTIEELHIDKVNFPYYGSIDSTPLFLIVAGKYLEATDDGEFILKLWPAILAAKDWVLKYGDENKDGLLDFRRRNINGPLNQCWKDGKDSPQFGERPIAPVEAQGYSFEALLSFNRIASALRKNDNIPSAYMDDLKENFHKEFFWPDENFYYLAIGGDGKKYASVASNPGHLLFSGLIDDNHKSAVVSRLFQADMWTPYGIRTHSLFNKDFNASSYQLGSVWPFDNWLIAEGLRTAGFVREYELVKAALLAAYRELGHIPELYSVTLDGKIQEIPSANPLQAWSSAGLLDLLE